MIGTILVVIGLIFLYLVFSDQHINFRDQGVQKVKDVGKTAGTVAA